MRMRTERSTHQRGLLVGLLALTATIAAAIAIATGSTKANAAGSTAAATPVATQVAGDAGQLAEPGDRTRDGGPRDGFGRGGGR
jgi:hypothetical protein